MAKIFKLKLCIIGEHACGKTSLIKNFVESAYSKDYRPTIGSNLFVKKLAFKSSDNEEYHFTITAWDIAGQERWQTMRHTYYRGAQGVFIVGDLTRKNTFHQIEKFWVDDFRKTMDFDVPIIVLANKNDLPSEISNEEVLKIGERCKINKVLFTSAKTGQQVNEAFSVMIKHCIGIDDIIPIPLK